MMKEQKDIQLLPDGIVQGKIFRIRDHNVMLDSDLAELYGTTTKRLKEQVKRNIARFPSQYMFELTDNEFEILRSHFATSKTGRGGARYLPMVFTEHGVLQVSNVLTSARAIQVGFKIIEVFVRLREMLASNSALQLQIEQLKKHLHNHDKSIELIFSYFDDKADDQSNNIPTRKQIGYRLKSSDNE